MKLLYAGTVMGEVIPSWNTVIFNCIRNRKCQPRYDVPIRGTDDLLLYADLTGKPTLIEAVVIASRTETEYSLTFGTYVVGQQPSEAWYGVFGAPVIDWDGDTVNCFFVRIIFTIGGIEHVFYSEQFTIENSVCDPLYFIQACYPNILTAADARDCNGVYYGFHAGPDEELGEINFRYFHKAYVRMGDITESKAKLSFTLFNNRVNYKTNVEQESLFTFELVPAFYKRHLLGIFALGNIRINGTQYTLSEEQDFAITDNDSKQWKMDVSLKEFCEQSFDCSGRDCTLLECCDPVVTGATVETGTEVVMRLINLNTGLNITGIFTVPDDGAPADARAVTAVGGYPILNGQQRDGSIHADHDGLSNLLVLVYTNAPISPLLTIKVTDSDATEECEPGNGLVAVVGTLNGQRLDNAETFSIKLSNESC